MKKKILLLASAACLLACAKPGVVDNKPDLTPIEAAKGVEIAKKIYDHHDNNVWTNMGDWETVKEFMPHKFTATTIGTINGSMKMPNEDGTVVERNYNDYKYINMKNIVDVENVYYHGYIYDQNREDFIIYNEDEEVLYYLSNFNNDKKVIIKKEPCSGSSKDDVITKFVNEVLNMGTFYESDEFNYKPALLDLIMGAIDILDDDCEDDYFYYADLLGNEPYEDTAIVYLDYIRWKLELREDKNQYYNYQFGSDDDKSLSIRHDISFDASMVDACNVSYTGYAKGMTALPHDYFIYSPPFRPDADFIDVLSSFPDIMVFKDNFMTHAEYVYDTDISSVESKSVKAGAFYNKIKSNRTVDIDYSNAEIVIPDISEYEEI